MSYLNRFVTTTVLVFVFLLINQIGFAQCEDQIRQLKAEAFDMNKAHKKEIDSLKTKYKLKIKELDDRLTVLRKDTSSLYSTIKNLRGTIEKKDKKISALIDGNSGNNWRKKFKELEDKHIVLKKDSTQLEVDKQIAQKNSKGFEEDKKQLAIRVGALRDSIKTLQSQIDTLEAEKTHTGQTLTARKHEIEQKQSKIDSLNTELSKEKGNSERLQAKAINDLIQAESNKRAEIQRISSEKDNEIAELNRDREEKIKEVKKEAEKNAEEAIKERDRTIADQKLNIARKGRELEAAAKRDKERKKGLIKAVNYLVSSEIYGESEINELQSILQENKDVLTNEISGLNGQLESYRRLTQVLNKSRALLNSSFNQNAVNQNLQDLRNLKNLSKIHQNTKVEFEYTLSKFCENQNKAKAYLQNAQGNDSHDIRRRILNDGFKEIPTSYSFIRGKLSAAKSSPGQVENINRSFKNCQ